MNNKGFTLVELLVVIAILGLATGFVATNFFGLIDSQEKFEYEVVGKQVAEAAYVYYSNQNANIDNTCLSASVLLSKGYISPKQGLLDDYSDELNAINFRAYKVNGEKKVDVYKNENDCKTCLNSPSSCSGSNDPAIIHY